MTVALSNSKIIVIKNIERNNNHRQCQNTRSTLPKPYFRKYATENTTREKEKNENATDARQY